MKAVVCEALGPPENLNYIDVPNPHPQTGQVLIEVKACGVNFPDNLIIQGLYQEKPALPFVPGMELSGVVTEVGDGVDALSVGDRVLSATGGGAFCEQVAVDVERCVRMPDTLGYVEGAAVLLVYGTSIHALRQRAAIQPGETLLVLGAAGGVGLSAVQLGKAMGARVIAGASNQEKLALAKANGADELVDYGSGDLKDQVKALTGGKGADVIYDPVGGDLFDQSTRCINFNGRLLIIGFASGTIPTLTAGIALVKGFSAVGVFWGRFATKEQPALHAENMSLVFEWLEQGKFSPHIDAVMPLSEAPAALRKIADRKVLGKLVLTTE